MNCRRVMNLMSAYVDGELTGFEMLAIRRHLSECAECGEEHESVRLMKQAVARLRTVAPREEFADAILSRLDEVEIPRYQRLVYSMANFVHRKLSPVAAALAASGIALVILSAGGVDGVRPQSNLVANSPFGARIEDASVIPEVPGSWIAITSGPLEVADPYSSQPTFRLTSLDR